MEHQLHAQTTCTAGPSLPPMRTFSPSRILPAVYTLLWSGSSLWNTAGTRLKGRAIESTHADGKTIWHCSHRSLFRCSDLHPRGSRWCASVSGINTGGDLATLSSPARVAPALPRVACAWVLNASCCNGFSQHRLLPATQVGVVAGRDDICDQRTWRCDTDFPGTFPGRWRWRRSRRCGPVLSVATNGAEFVCVGGIEPVTAKSINLFPEAERT